MSYGRLAAVLVGCVVAGVAGAQVLARAIQDDFPATDGPGLFTGLGIGIVLVARWWAPRE